MIIKKGVNEILIDKLWITRLEKILNGSLDNIL